MASRSREASAAVSDVGEIPAVVNPERREACRLDLHAFLVTYFPGSTGLSPFSEDHLRVIGRLQSAILEGGRRLNACYRGFAKSSITERAALWATLYGHRRFVVIFGADQEAAANNLNSIRRELLDVGLLLHEDFPEVCHPIKHLQNKSQRAGSQTYHGELTHAEWRTDGIRFARIPGAAGSEATIYTRGILAGYLGMKVIRSDGTQQRPDFIFIDDPQTDESATSPIQVRKTLSTIRKGILFLGGHRKKAAVAVCATVKAPDDAIDQLLADSSWQGERIPMVRRWPDAHKTLWLDKYATIRRTYDPMDLGDQKRAQADATAFYSADREAMDLGGEVSWESCYDPDVEVSALQHAYNLLIDDGEEAFASECQNRPLRPEDEQPALLTIDQICAKVNTLPRGTVPAGSVYVTGFVDVHGSILVWTVCAFAADFTGSVVAYGVYPPQKQKNCSPERANPTLMEQVPGAGKEGAIRAGLEKLTGELLGREWPGENAPGQPVPVHKIRQLLVDSGYETDTILEFTRTTLNAAIVMASKGFSIGVKNRPFADYTRHQEQRFGLNWYVKRVQGRLVQQVGYDTYFWKSFTFARLGLSIGDRGALTLHKGEPAEHRLFAEHLVSERPLLVEAAGRKIVEWSFPSVPQDNHWLDCLVGTMVAASMLGAVLPGAPIPKRGKTLQELQANQQKFVPPWRR